ncbi:MAG: phosphoribosylformylglycinamidine synthase subunit PurS [Deltaproteobacteria bacterium]|nr:phosphoribosylformylglycinamidine synthase subunit PurS [Deltaproteobacteria bacterium]
MVCRLEIGLKRDLRDAEGAGIRQKARDYFALAVEDVRVIRILTIDADLDREQLESVRTRIFTNPVTEESSFGPLGKDFDWIIWIGLRPGVRDTAGSTAQEAVEDLLKIRFQPHEAIYTSKLYLIQGVLSEEGARILAGEILANDIIQHWKVFSRQSWDPEEGIGFILPKVILDHEPEVSTIRIGSDEELKRISRARNLALQESDIPIIRRYFLREDILAERERLGLSLPTDVELEYISQSRSDHCNHNTFKGLFRYRDLGSGHREEVDNLFKTCIEAPTLEIMRRKDWVVSVLWDNAGVARFDDEHYYVITGETHNSPSNMEAYGGAITGIVGIYRDPMGTGKGAKLVLGMYGYCVGHRDYAGPLKPHLHPRRLLDGVIEGVRDGGNKSGIPTPYGILLFDDGYMGKCLVYVTAVGIMPARIQSDSSHEKTTRPGDLVIISGGRVGKDGIHGVTAASETYSEHTPAGHVQIGDPYTQKKMHDFLLEARDEGLISFITDNGGGGLSSSIGESARFSNGCRVDLDRVPLKYEGLDQWEIWVSESQERMTIAVKPEALKRFMELSEKHAVESTVIGEYNDSGYLRLDYRGKTCALVKMDFLQSDFPQWEFDAEWTPPEMRGLKEPVISEPLHQGALIKTMLSRPNICSRNWIARQYDHEVQGGSVVKPLIGKNRDMPTDAIVTRPVLYSERGLALTQALNPFYSAIDTYPMTAVTIDEAVRRILAVGAEPDQIGGVDNFCWPTIQYDPLQNPDGRYKAAQLVRSNWALRDTCLAFGIPLLSGKDSMYIDGNLEGPFLERRKVSGLPSLLFTASGIVLDVRKCVTMEAKSAGDLVYILGETRNELGGGEYYQFMGETGLHVPRLKGEEVWPLYLSVCEAIRRELAASVHAVSRGGLGVHLATVAMGGELGMEAILEEVPMEGDLSDTQILYSESAGRFIVTVDPANREAFERLFSGRRIGCIGHVTDSPLFHIRGKGGETLIQEGIGELKDAWKRPFGDLI